MLINIDADIKLPDCHKIFAYKCIYFYKYQGFSFIDG